MTGRTVQAAAEAAHAKAEADAIQAGLDAEAAKKAAEEAKAAAELAAKAAAEKAEAERIAAEEAEEARSKAAEEAKSRADAIEELERAAQVEIERAAAAESVKLSKVMTEEDAEKHIELAKSCMVYDEINPPKREKAAAKVPKGISKPFDASQVAKKELPNFEKAALMIQKHVRGFLDRNHVSNHVNHMPRVIDLKIDFATDLPLNNDLFSSKPDVYLVVNAISMKKKGKDHKLQEHCESCYKTRTICGSLNPVYDEEFSITSVGHGKIVVNVMSNHTFWAPTLIGQATIEVCIHNVTHNYMINKVNE